MPKEKIISFKIEAEAKKYFETICRDKFQTVSQALYSFVHTQIKYSKGKPISLTELKERKG